MKIRQRLAFRFTIISGIVTGAILVFIYFVTAGFVHADFIDRLHQQTELEALLYKSPTAELDSDLLVNTFGLIQPSVVIYQGDTLRFKRGPRAKVPPEWITQLRQKKSSTHEDGEFSTVGGIQRIDDKDYVVFVTVQDVYGQRKLSFLFQALTSGWLISLILAYYTGLYFSKKALQPVTHVVNEVNKISEENLSHRVSFTKPENAALEKPDEIDELIQTFNDLIDRLENAFVAQKRFLQNASHELKTPLTAIIAEVELALGRTRQPEEYQRTLRVVMQEAERLEQTTKGLLVLTRLEETAEQAERVQIELTGLLTEVVASFRIVNPTRNIIQRPTNRVLLISGNPLLLRMALSNIIDNALKYSHDRVEIALDVNNDQAIISIRDYGIGIPADELSKLCVPLVRASNATTIGGSGLGLALVDRIMRVHAGTLTLQSTEGHGTTCQLTFPLEE